MYDNLQYRLSKKQKAEIAQNLIDILQKDSEITKQTIEFVENWIDPGPDGNRKTFLDVWDIVLRNYLPTTRPILFRTCEGISDNGIIASFTGRLECARRFSDSRNSLIICDTKQILKFEEQLHQPGEYMHTFYPLVSVLDKAKTSGGCGFSKRILDKYIGEDEYIMMVDIENMDSFSWIKNDL
jgi:hypothetical protein